MKLLNTVSILIALGATATNATRVLKKGDAKKGAGKHTPHTKFCYRDGTTAEVSASADDYSYDEDADLALVDLGHLKIDNKEALLVEVTVTSMIFRVFDVEYDDDVYTELINVLAMRAFLYKGCTSQSDCQTEGIVPIDPKPSTRIPIQFEYLNVIKDDDSGVEVLEMESTETTTGKFYFPVFDLPKDDYYLSLAFFLGAGSDNDEEGYSHASVEMGPHLISVQKIEAEDEVCDVEIVDDDYVAEGIFWY